MTTTTTTTTATPTATTMTISTGLARSNGTGAIRAAVAGLNTTQLFLSLDVDGNGLVTYTDVTGYCTAQAKACSASEVASALRLQPDTSAPGVSLAVFVAGIDADAVYATDTDTVAAIVAAAAAADDDTKLGHGDRDSDGEAAATARAMARCMRGGMQWLPCATTNECYQAKARCDGGTPDCSDGSDEEMCRTSHLVTPALVFLRSVAWGLAWVGGRRLLMWAVAKRRLHPHPAGQGYASAPAVKN